MSNWDDDDMDFIWQQQLEEQQRKETRGSHDGVDWNMFDSIFGTPHALARQQSTHIRKAKDETN